jgi:hypothetical protein
MTHPQPVVPLSGPVLGGLKAANHHETVVLLIFQDFPSSPAARFAVTKMSCATSVLTSMASLRLYSWYPNRWVLTRGTLGRALVTAEDLVIDDAKEESWVSVHENERDLLEDTIYRRLVSVWSEFS